MSESWTWHIPRVPPIGRTISSLWPGSTHSTRSTLGCRENELPSTAKPSPYSPPIVHRPGAYVPHPHFKTLSSSACTPTMTLDDPDGVFFSPPSPFGSHSSPFPQGTTPGLFAQLAFASQICAVFLECICAGKFIGRGLFTVLCRKQQGILILLFK